MKFGADRKRLAVLGGLVLIGIYALWSGYGPDSDSGSSDGARRATPAPAVQPSTPAATARVMDRRSNRSRPTEWSPSMSGKALDPLRVDPTLRMDLLAKVQQVELGGAQRNLFQFGDAAPRVEDKKPLPNVPKIPIRGGPMPTQAGLPPGPPPKPVAPPITLKYYGYSSPRSNPRKRAFFLDGDEIIVAGEGELMKKRYRLVKIGINSVTVEDTQFNNNEQVLPLAEDAANS